MSWTDARRKLIELTTGRRASINRGEASGGGVLAPGGAPINGRGATLVPNPRAGPDTSPRAGLPVQRARSLCVASGKGGTGKSVVTASVAHLYSQRARTLVVDADLGVGNAHILQDVTPTRSFVDVVEGEVPVRDVLVNCGGSVDLIAAGSGVPRMAELSSYELQLIASGIEDLERDYGYLVVDSAAGLARQTLAFARSCDEVLLVTTPDLTAMTDAYAFLKVLTGRAPGCEPLLIVNRARSGEEAREVAQRIGRVSKRFLGRAPRPIGWIPDDPMVQACVNRRGAVSALEPNCPAARALARLSVSVHAALATRPAQGAGRALMRALA